jgi:excisionase family DNA binding protein
MISLTESLDKEKSETIDDKIMSRKDVLKYLDISSSTLYRLCKDKSIKFSKIYRLKKFWKSDVDKLMESNSSENLSL